MGVALFLFLQSYEKFSSDWILSVNFMATKIKPNKMITMTKASVTSTIFYRNVIFSTNFHWLISLT